jgi:hypothetical protein
LALLAPPKATLLSAVKAEPSAFVGFPPGFTAKNIQKFLPKSIYTDMGHLDQTRQNIMSTKPHEINSSDVQPPKSAIRNRYIFTESVTIHGDPTGKLPITSQRGNRYILVVFDEDSNSIHAEPMKSRSKEEHVRAYNKIIEELEASGLKPRFVRLDNEASELLKQYFKEQNMEYQLVPPGMHRRNLAERAIRTFKSHFITGLCITDEEFPVNQWDLLIPQAVLTLNLLRRSKMNPKLSAHAQVFGAYDYMSHPIAPIGTKVVAHIKPQDRKTWAPKGEIGFYVGPSMEHYRCYKVFCPRTKSIRVVDTLSWHMSNKSLPTVTYEDQLLESIDHLRETVNNPSASLLPHQQDLTSKVLKELVSVFEPPQKPTESLSPSSSTEPSTDPLSSKGDEVNSKGESLSSSKGATANNLGTKSESVSNSKGVMFENPEQVTEKSTAPPTPVKTSPSATKESRQARRYSQRVRTKRLQKAHRIATLHHKRRDPFEKFTHNIFSVLNADTGELQELKQLMEGPESEQWINGLCTEWGRIANGYNGSKGTNTVKFIHPSQIPKHKRATYARVVADYRPQKADPYRVRITVGGDRIEYDGDCYTPSADLTTAKLLLNSVVSTDGAKFLGIDIKDFYLNTVLDDYQYMRIPAAYVPQAIRDQYNLHNLIINGYIYLEIQKGMYGLPQSGKLANDELTHHLIKHGYYQARHTPGLFLHETRSTQFSLIVDDFGVLYTNKNDAQHLIDTLQAKYEITIDWKGEKFLGIDLQWDYEERTVTLSMPGYCERAIARFQHSPANQHESAPSPWQPPTYGKNEQDIEEEPLEPPDESDIKRLQQVTGTFLYYARAIDTTMIHAVSSLSTSKSEGKAAIQRRIDQLLDYAHANPNASITFRKSDMILHVHSDASFNSEPKGRSRYGGYHYLSTKDDDPPLNAPILAESKIIDVVVSSAQESETAGAFNTAKSAVPIRTTLEEMGFKQPATLITTDNKTSVGIINGTMRQKKSKIMHNKFYWIQDRVQQGQFRLRWQQGSDNLADYFTKHHPRVHHKTMRPKYVNTCTLSCKGV